LVLSPKSYNQKSNLAILCPITSQVKGYPFEVPLPTGSGINGAIPADHLKRLDWKARDAQRAGKAPASVLRRFSPTSHHCCFLSSIHFSPRKFQSLWPGVHNVMHSLTHQNLAAGRLPEPRLPPKLSRKQPTPTNPPRGGFFPPSHTILYTRKKPLPKLSPTPFATL
jgi:hypothetical protein